MSDIMCCMSAIDRLAGRRVLEEAVSPVNGTITVVREFLWGTYIMAGGLPQSGGLAERIWKKPLKKVKSERSHRRQGYGGQVKLKEILILGFGGGGMVSILKKHWPDAKITGVDIDSLMVELGRKYLQWDEENLKILIGDAGNIVDKLVQKGEGKFKDVDGRWQMVDAKYDLVCVDMYVGQQVPGKFNTVSFVEKIKKLLSKDGIAVFNRLYGGGNKEKALGFGHKLERVFSKIDIVRPEANMMFICWVK